MKNWKKKLTRLHSTSIYNYVGCDHLFRGNLREEGGRGKVKRVDRSMNLLQPCMSVICRIIQFLSESKCIFTDYSALTCRNSREIQILPRRFHAIQCWIVQYSIKYYINECSHNTAGLSSTYFSILRSPLDNNVLHDWMWFSTIWLKNAGRGNGTL